MANGIVLGGSLRCRKTPASTGAVLGSFSNGTVLTVTISSDADWYQTTWNGSVGYVMKSFVAVANDTVMPNALCRILWLQLMMGRRFCTSIPVIPVPVTHTSALLARQSRQSTIATCGAM